MGFRPRDSEVPVALDEAGQAEAKEALAHLHCRHLRACDCYALQTLLTRASQGGALFRVQRRQIAELYQTLTPPKGR